MSNSLKNENKHPELYNCTELSCTILFFTALRVFFLLVALIIQIKKLEAMLDGWGLQHLYRNLSIASIADTCYFHLSKA